MATRKRTTTPPVQGTPQPAKVAGWKLTGKQPAKAYRPDTARALWWQAVQHALAKGPQPAAALYKGHAAAPPSVPKNGKLAGQCEPPAGWYGFFTQQGLVQAVQVPVQPS